jgi:hypothetical protein
MMKWVAAVSVVLLLTVLWVFSGRAPEPVYRVFPGYFPDPDRWWEQSPLEPAAATQAHLSTDVVRTRDQRQDSARRHLGVATDKQILFGDTHVHTTNSVDAFLYSLPLMHGATGAYPPAYACDYARFVSQLDFYFLTDHAESFTAQQWRDAIESVQQCNQLAGDAENPDMVAFIGWEWTQVGATAKQHFGHHNVLFRDDAFELLPKRPVAAIGAGVSTVATRSEASKQSPALGLIDPRHRDYYAAYNRWIEQMAATPPCEPSTPSPALPADCYETAATPGELYQKLDQWGFDSIVIPHGTSWGFYTPPGANWRHQLTSTDYDPDKVRAIELYSGHGNSEIFRDFAERGQNSDGEWYCPEPQTNYLPACWQAGEIIRQRCLREAAAPAICEQRAAEARNNYVRVDTIHGFMTVPGSDADEWLDAGQARDVFLPAFNYRPRKSVQYGLALQNFDDPEGPQRFRWGIVASTDSHTAKAGNGFKQNRRKRITDSNGVRGPFWEELSRGTVDLPPAAARSLAPDQIDPVAAGIFASEVERTTSFMTAGGLAAVHAEGRNRQAIWDAMKRREVYGTSGHRILLWFDLLTANGASWPMGSEVAINESPRFRVSAMGSFKQLPGCPDHVTAALEKRRLDKMAAGECYHAADERYRIEHIEVVKIRPQIHADEPVTTLIEDNWRVFDCDPSADGCTVEFSDPDFAAEGRDALYYVRALEEPVATINAGNLRTRFDANGQAVSVAPCYGDYRTEETDDCTAPASQRAWSSPIFVDYQR